MRYPESTQLCISTRQWTECWSGFGSVANVGLSSNVPKSMQKILRQKDEWRSKQRVRNWIKHLGKVFWLIPFTSLPMRFWTNMRCRWLRTPWHILSCNRTCSQPSSWMPGRLQGGWSAQNIASLCWPPLFYGTTVGIIIYGTSCDFTESFWTIALCQDLLM